MPKRWLVKRRWLVVLEATTYTRIYGQQQLGKCLCVAGSQPTQKKICCKIIRSCKIFSYALFVQKYFNNKIKANYGETGDGEGMGMWLDTCLPVFVARSFP